MCSLPSVGLLKHEKSSNFKSHSFSVFLCWNRKKQQNWLPYNVHRSLYFCQSCNPHKLTLYTCKNTEPQCLTFLENDLGFKIIHKDLADTPSKACRNWHAIVCFLRVLFRDFDFRNTKKYILHGTELYCLVETGL